MLRFFTQLSESASVLAERLNCTRPAGSEDAAELPRPSGQQSSSTAPPASQTYPTLTVRRFNERLSNARAVEPRLRMMCLTANALDKNTGQIDAFFREAAEHTWDATCIELLHENTPVANTMLKALMQSPWTHIPPYSLLLEMEKLQRIDVLEMMISGQSGRVQDYQLSDWAGRTQNARVAGIYADLKAGKARYRAEFLAMSDRRKQQVNTSLDRLAQPYRAARESELGERHRQNQAAQAPARGEFLQHCAAAGIDPEHPQAGLDLALWHAPFDDLLDIYHMPAGLSALVWREGANKGKIFSLESTLPGSGQRRHFSLEMFSERVISILYQVDSELIGHGVKQYHKNDIRTRAHNRIARLYHEGDEDFLPLCQARLQDHEINELCVTMHTGGVMEWLAGFAQEQGLGYLDMQSAQTFCEWDAFYIPTRKEAMLDYAYSHGTSSTVLPSLLSAGALLCLDELRQNHIQKVSGEDGTIQHGDDPDVVSFWDHARGRPVRGGYGYMEKLDFPIALIVSKAAMAGNVLKAGTESDEVVVPGRFRLDDIERILVPSFKQDEVRRLLALHGNGGIEVSPLRLEEGIRPDLLP